MTEQDRDDTTRNGTVPADPSAAEADLPQRDVGVEDSGADAAFEVGEAPSEPDEPAEGGEEVSGEVRALREELESLNDRHLRLAAEFDNYRKRNQRDREMLATRLQADLVGSLLDVIDDLQRVAKGDEGGDASAVLEGVRLVEKKLMTVLEGAGLTPVEAEGARFDPELMEALGTVPTDDPEKDGHVADVFQRGYRLREMLLRPARVRVYQEGATD